MADATEPTPEEQLEALTLSDEEKVVMARVAEILRRVHFGTVVLARDVNRDGFADALISTIGEDFSVAPAPPVAVPQSVQERFSAASGVTSNNKFIP